MKIGQGILAYSDLHRVENPAGIVARGTYLWPVIQSRWASPVGAAWRAWTTCCVRLPRRKRRPENDGASIGQRDWERAYSNLANKD